MFAHVLFCRGYITPDATIKDRFVRKAIQVLTQCESVHCAVEFHGTVVDPRMARTWRVPVTAYQQIFRDTLVACVRVPITTPPPVHGVPDGPRAIWPSVKQWALRRDTFINDCLGVTRMMLQVGGFGYPVCTTPRGLFDTLTINKGLEFVSRQTTNGQESFPVALRRFLADSNARFSVRAGASRAQIAGQ